MPVDLDVFDGRLPEPVEIAAYYLVSEALTNTAKHAAATRVHVNAEAREDILRVEVSDGGRGGAAFGHGSGLLGLKDRVEALGGQLSLTSPHGVGTTVMITLPLSDRSEERLTSAGGRQPEGADPVAVLDPSVGTRPPSTPTGVDGESK